MALDLAIFLFESIPYLCVQNLIGEKTKRAGHVHHLERAPPDSLTPTRGVNEGRCLPCKRAMLAYPQARGERSDHGKGGTPCCQVSQLAMM
jgi:hypothetical protein